MKYILTVLMLLIASNAYAVKEYQKESDATLRSIETKTETIVQVHNIERLKNSRAALLEEVAEIDAILAEATNLGINVE